MISQLLGRAYASLNQSWTRQLGQVGLRLHAQAQTKIWARMALDMFFPRVFEVKDAPEHLLRHIHSPLVPAPIAPKFSSSRQALFAMPPPLPPFASKVLNALAAQSHQSASKTPEPAVLFGVLSSQQYAALDDSVKHARKAALARMNATYAEGREIYALATALNVRIDVFGRADNSNVLTLAASARPPESGHEPKRIVLFLENEHFVPMRNGPKPDSEGFLPMHVPFDAAADRVRMGIGKADPFGNCFYHSVAQLVESYDVHTLRQMACDEAENPSPGNDPVPVDIVEDAKRYIES